MSNARSPRDVCSTTIGTRGLMRCVSIATASAGPERENPAMASESGDPHRRPLEPRGRRLPRAGPRRRRRADRRRARQPPLSLPAVQPLGARRDDEGVRASATRPLGADLGGRRVAAPDSVNHGARGRRARSAATPTTWRPSSSRLGWRCSRSLARERRTAVMCAEADWTAATGACSPTPSPCAAGEVVHLGADRRT